MTARVSGNSSLAVVVTPSPHVAEASRVPGSKAQAFTPRPIGTVARTLPFRLSVGKI